MTMPEAHNRLSDLVAWIAMGRGIFPVEVEVTSDLGGAKFHFQVLGPKGPLIDELVVST